MKPRVLMFGWEFPPFNSGGLGVACLGLSKALASLGIQVTFVMPKKVDVHAEWTRFVFPHGSLRTRVFDSPLTPYITRKGYIRDRDSTETIYAGDLFGEVMRYREFGGVVAREEEFDVIYAHDWLSFGAGVEAKELTGKPLIVHVHATEFDRSGGGSVNQDVYEIEREGMEKADRIIAVSELTKRIIVDHYDIPDAKIRVVYNGIDETTAPQLASEITRLRAMKRAGRKIVLFLGRITLQKGPDYFVHAAAKVLRKNPKVVFILSGSGDMEEEMMRLAAQLGISDRVLFTGFLHDRDRDEAYASADLFVMPSVSEPFGIAPLEAMKMGTPVLISKQSGVSEVIKHALKVDFWDVDEMANKILSALSHRGLAATLSENGKREADQLTWMDSARSVESVMREVVHS